MSPSFHRSICYALLSVFACVALLGNGLHVVPGANHFSDSAGAADCRNCCFGHHSEETSGRNGEGEPQSAKGNHCPICQFFAQSQSQPPATVNLARPERWEVVIDVDRPRLALVGRALYSARAPPAA